MNETARLIRAETRSCINSSVCRSLIISMQRVASHFHAVLLNAASLLGSKLLSTLNSNPLPTLHRFYLSAGKKYKVIRVKRCVVWRRTRQHCVNGSLWVTTPLPSICRNNPWSDPPVIKKQPTMFYLWVFSRVDGLCASDTLKSKSRFVVSGSDSLL